METLKAVSGCLVFPNGEQLDFSEEKDFTQAVRNAAFRYSLQLGQSVVLEMGTQRFKVSPAGSINEIKAVDWGSSNFSQSSTTDLQSSGFIAPVKDGAASVYLKSITTPATDFALEYIPKKPFLYLVANPKGGSGKTPLAIGLASAFGHLYGASVLLDLDPTGNLAGRAGFDTSFSTPNLSALAAAGTDISSGLAWLSENKFFASGARTSIYDKDSPSKVVPPCLSDLETQKLLTVLQAQYPIIGCDAGNNDADLAFLAAGALANQLIIPIKFDKPSCVKAGELLNSLYEIGFQSLVRNAIIVASYSYLERPYRSDVKAFRNQFEKVGNEVFIVPSDRHISSGGVISWAKLRKKTQAAFIDIAKRCIFRHERGQ